MPRGRTTERARRGRGEGNVRLRPDGRWEARRSLGFDSKGQRVTRSVYGDTKQEVLLELAKLALSPGRPKLLDAQLSVDECFEHWMSWLESDLRGANTRATYRCTFGRHVSSKIGSLKVKDITPNHIEVLQTQLHAEKVSLRMRQAVHTALNGVFKYAVKHGLMLSNPQQDLRRPGGARQARVKNELEAWNEAEVHKFLQTVAGHEYEAFFVLAVGLGMRRGELTAVHRSDFDLKRARLHICRSVMEVGGHFQEKGPKTFSGKRTVDLPEYVVNILNSYFARMPEGRELVFVGENGNYLRRSNFDRRVFCPLVRAAGVRPMTIQGLRHTHATLLLKQGIPVKVVSERLGHKNIRVTLDTYAHVIPGMQAEAAKMINQVMTGFSEPVKRAPGGRKKRSA